MFSWLHYKSSVSMKQILLVGVIFGLLLGCKPKATVEQKSKKQNAVAVDSAKKVEKDRYGFPIDSMQVADHKVKRNESLYLILDKLDLDSREIYNITRQAGNLVDARNLKPGQPYRTYASADSGSAVHRMVWQPNSLEYVVFDWSDSLQVYRASRPLTTRKAVASGVISSSLYQTISEEGASPLLAYKMAEIFAWQINFFGLRDGDAFNVLYNRKYIGDEFIGIGEVLAAEFVHRGETFKAYKFREGDTDGYFNEKGESVEKALLKAPFKFSQRISSHFSHSRYHPILKKRMPHYGVDYAAPYGTPVLAVGDGVVTEARYRGANGNIVKINHNASYRTAYLHLSGFASGIRRGARVEQGEVIGYVGSTGRSTGSHLDYRLYKNNRPVNPITVELPSSEAVPDSLMDEFQNRRKELERRLEEKQKPPADEKGPVMTEVIMPGS